MMWPHVPGFRARTWKALEDGNHDVLPPGPFFRGYLRQYLEFLGEDMEETDGPAADALDQQIEDAVAAATTAAMESSQNIPLLRLVITGFVLTLGIVLALQVGHRISTHGTLAPDGTPFPQDPRMSSPSTPSRTFDSTSRRTASPSTPSVSAGPSRCRSRPLTRSRLTSPISAGFASHTMTSASNRSEA